MVLVGVHLFYGQIHGFWRLVDVNRVEYGVGVENGASDIFCVHSRLQPDRREVALFRRGPGFSQRDSVRDPRRQIRLPLAVKVALSLVHLRRDGPVDHLAHFGRVQQRADQPPRIARCVRIRVREPLRQSNLQVPLFWQFVVQQKEKVEPRRH